MILFDHDRLARYQKEDPVLKRLETAGSKPEALFASHRWLVESSPKRMIYWHLYGDLLEAAGGSLRILDVGGGFCALTRELLEKHAYTLLDLLAHDDPSGLRSVEQAMGRMFWESTDWLSFRTAREYDVVVANDLFPNVDQRLELFIEKFLPVCREMRLSLTYHNSPRFYKVRREDAGEIMHMLAWDGDMVRRVLDKFSKYLVEPCLDVLSCNPPSLFSNNRQVSFVILRR